MKDLKLILTGSIAFDYLMRFPGRFTDHILPDKLDTISLSFLVDSMIKQRGGVAPNIAYNYALLGGKPTLFATVGDDFVDYGQWLDSQGIDISLLRVVPGVNTASFFANTDRDNNQIASFYPGAMGFAAELSFYELEEPHPDLVLVSPNDPAAMEKYVQECQDLFIPYIYDPSQQIVRLSPAALRKGIEGAKALFVNEYEFGLINKHTGMEQQDILDYLEFLVVTRGKDGADIISEEGAIHVPPFPPARISDPTGVGDAFRGGFLTGLRMGWDLMISGAIGALAATYCLEKPGPQGHSYSVPTFIDRFRTRYDDGGILDEL